jgi:hypothetical protein
LTLKTTDGEKEYPLAEEVWIVFGSGQKIAVSQKPTTGGGRTPANSQRPRIFAYVLKPGNQVELVLAEKENKVKEIHWDNRTPAAAVGKPAGAPDAKQAPPKKDDGKN